MNISQRAQGMNPFLAMEVMERAVKLQAQGHNIIHLEVGEPDFDTPEVIIKAGTGAMSDGATHYTHSLGRPDLREAIAEYYQKRFKATVDPDRIIVTSGLSPALFMTFAALLEPGDEVIMSNPRYACYPQYVNFSGGKIVDVPVGEDDGFQLHVDAVKAKISDKTRAILINSPSNPTGQLLSPERMEGIAKLGPLVVSDEIYSDLVYGDGEAHSILEYTDNAVSMHGFSKTFAMTGWRLGWMVVPEWLVRPLQKIHQNFFICANDFVQEAGITALRSEEAWAEVEKMRQRYDARRRLIIDGLRSIGLGIKVEPLGAFYVLANANHIHNNSLELAFDIVEKAHVGVGPGVDFGSEAEGFLRFSYASSRANIEEGLKRLDKYFKEDCPWN